MLTDLATLLLDLVAAAHRNDAIALGAKLREVHAREDALRAENAKLREHPVVWADDATPFDGPQVAALLAENESLRAAVRAADDIMTASSADEIANAFSAYREARARCGDVTKDGG